MKLLIAVPALLLTLGIGFFSGQPVSAEQCGGVETSIIKCDQTGEIMCEDGSSPTAEGICTDGSTPTDIETTGIWGILILVINILTAGIGVVAIAGVVYASILYASAAGSAEQVKKAMEIITNIVIGVIAYALVYSLLNFLIPGGIFN